LIVNARWPGKPVSTFPYRALGLALALRLVDGDGHRAFFHAPGSVDAAQRRGAEIVEANADPHVGVRHAQAMDRIEPTPAEAVAIGFRPAVAGTGAVVADPISADKARRNPDAAGCGDEDLCGVLGTAASQGQGLCRRHEPMTLRRRRDIDEVMN